MVRCSCGQVEIQALGEPIYSLVCYCDDCQKGAEAVEVLTGARPVREADGGTPYSLYRKDRVKIVRGREFIKPYKVRGESPTRRNVATCCNSAVILDFDNWQPWVSLYHTALVGRQRPPIQMRIFTKYAPSPDAIPKDIPAYRTFPLTFPLRMLPLIALIKLGL